MRVFRGVDELYWLEVARKCEYATFFHTPFWPQLIAETYPDFGQATIGVELGSGVRVVLPLLEVGRTKRVFRSLVSTFAGCYGDLIADGVVSDEERHDIYRAACSWNTERLQITGNPFAPVREKGEDFRQDEDFTQFIDLRGGYEQVWTGYRYSCQKQIRKGAGKRFRIHPASSSDDIDVYYDIYRENLEYWGQPEQGYPKRLFEVMFENELPEPAEVTLWLIRTQANQIVGGTLVFYWNWHAVEWHAVFRRNFFRLGVRDYLVDHIIADACKRGLRVYDFNPSGGYEGVARFKSSLGAARGPVLRWEWDRNRLYDYSRRVWRGVRDVFPHG